LKRGVALALLLALLVAPAAVLALVGTVESEDVEATGETVRVVEVLAPGSHVTLEYWLSASNGSGWTLLDRRTVEFEVLGVEWPFLVTTAGPVPIAFLYPVTPAADPGNPHFVFVSLFLGDASCMVLDPSGDGYYAAPRPGCSLYAADVRLSPDGMLYDARLLVPLGNGTVIAEYVVVASVAPNGTVQVEVGDPICWGPFSPYLEYTAAGAYLVENATVNYIGRPPADVNATVIWKHDPRAQNLWDAVSSGEWNGVVVVSSPLAPVG